MLSIKETKILAWLVINCGCVFDIDQLRFMAAFPCS